MVVALGDGEQQPCVRPAERVARVGGERHEVQVDAGRAHDDGGLARAIGAERGAGDGVGQVGAGHGRGRRDQRGQPDERGVVDQAMAQGALAGEAVERVRRRAGTAVGGDLGDDLGQRRDRRSVTVHQPERLAVVRADADVEAGAGIARRRWVVSHDDAAHLEAQHLAAQDPVLLDRFRAGGDDDGPQGEGRRGELGRRGPGLRVGPVQGAAVDLPDVGRRREGGSPSGEEARVGLGQDVEPVDALAGRPGQRPAEPGGGVVLEQDPALGVAHEGGAGRERPWGAVGRAEMIPDQGLELERPQLGSALVGHDRRGQLVAVRLRSP